MIQFLRLTRPINLVITAITMYGLGSYLEFALASKAAEGIKSFNFFLLVFSTVLIAAAGNVINDYFDIRADRINKPDRLIIGIHVKKRWAIISHWMMNFAAFGIAVYLSWRYQSFWYLFIHLLSINLLWGYSMYFKRKVIIGNIIIAALTALVPVLVAIYFHLQIGKTVGIVFPYSASIDIIWTNAMLFGGFAFLLNLVRELVKDIQDIPGDKVLRARTIPIIYGVKSSKFICYFLLIAALVSAAYSIIELQIAEFYASLPIWIACLFIVAACFLLVFAESRKELKKVDLFLKLAMVAGLAAPICWRILIEMNG